MEQADPEQEVQIYFYKLMLLFYSPNAPYLPEMFNSIFIFKLFYCPQTLPFFFFFFFLGLYMQHIEIPRLRSNQSCSCQPTPQPQQCQIQVVSVTYITDTAMPDLRHSWDLHNSSWQCGIFNPLSKAWNWTCILMDISQVHNPLSHSWNSMPLIFQVFCIAYLQPFPHI